jgi:membrane associated rhomboid family serine protease
VRHQRVALLALIGANVAGFVTQLILEISQPEFVRDYLGISNQGVGEAYAWQFATAIFLHTNAWHFGFNMLMLYLFGRDLESIIGQRHFVLLYAAGAITGELGHLFLMPTSTVLFAGSGGVAAIVVAYATILPGLDLGALIPFGFLRRIRMTDAACAIVGIAFVLILIDRGEIVGHSALLGGCVAGWLYPNLLGYGRISVLRRFLNRRRLEARRYQQMSLDQLMAKEIDPLLEKISCRGFRSLTRTERRNLLRARQTILEKQR